MQLRLALLLKKSEDNSLAIEKRSAWLQNSSFFIVSPRFASDFVQTDFLETNLVKPEFNLARLAIKIGP